jgi:flagellar basal body rod protein FlgF
MSRALPDIVRAYKNMDIENIKSDVESPVAKGLLAKKNINKSNDAMDMTNPLMRIGKQMKVIRKHRDELKNANS